MDITLNVGLDDAGYTRYTIYKENELVGGGSPKTPAKELTEEDDPIRFTIISLLMLIDNSGNADIFVREGYDKIVIRTEKEIAKNDVLETVSERFPMKVEFKTGKIKL